MRIVKLKGGLGNQMFQYAFAKYIEKKWDEKVLLDFSAYGFQTKDEIRVPRIGKFNLSLDAATSKEINEMCLLPHSGNSQSALYKAGIFLEKTVNKKYFWETSKTREFIPIDTIHKYRYFDGYWQSYYYVDEVIDSLNNDFIPKEDISLKSRSFIDTISAQNAIFIGVRKGDYTAKKRQRDHFGSFSSQYYQQAINYICEHTNNPQFYVFSNDIEWCKKNINWGIEDIHYREKEQQHDDFEELIIMSSCKHAIIVNSTYNWWGAYLIKNKNKIIICPEKWYFDNTKINILPDDWIKIPGNV